jgi:prevent-host-death family protein
LNPEPGTPNRERSCPGVIPVKRRIARHVAQVTISGHNVVMKQVRIAELKARLSEYLRAVRRGETIAVLDRETPVAQIVPMRERPALRVRPPAPGAPPPNRVRLPRPAKLKLDIVDLLLDERQGNR